MDKEYIDKNEILYQMSMGLIPQGYEWTRAYALARKLIKGAPAADVVPVVHGEWILHKDGSGTCNQCGITAKNIWDYDGWQNYCGRCGARMDGGK